MNSLQTKHLKIAYIFKVIVLKTGTLSVIWNYFDILYNRLFLTIKLYKFKLAISENVKSKRRKYVKIFLKHTFVTFIKRKLMANYY